jgi:phosphohistidine phosphatase
MLVYIVRHGESEAPAKGKGHATEERHLTPDGRLWAKRVVSVAEKELGFRPDRILSSPLARAKETAEIARETLDLKSEIQIEECLLGERPVKDVYATLRKLKSAESVALVSHLPLIDHLVADLLGAESNIRLHTGAIAGIQCKGNPGHGKGSLRWLLPPLQWFDGKQWPS